jgi:hypothetical protein
MNIGKELRSADPLIFFIASISKKPNVPESTPTPVPLSQIPEIRLAQIPNPSDFGFGVPLSQIPEIRLAQIPNPSDFGFGVPLSQIPEIRLAQIPNPSDFGFGVPLSQIPEIRLAQIPNPSDFGFGVPECFQVHLPTDVASGVMFKSSLIIIKLSAMVYPVYLPGLSLSFS